MLTMCYVYVSKQWNEYGEGGIVSPTRGEGWMKLEAIEAVFGGERTW